MIETVQRGDFVADHVGCPIAGHARADQSVQRQGRTPHDVSAHVVIVRGRQHLRAFLDQRQQQSLGETILYRRIDRIGQVLLHDVGVGIDHAVADLSGWQGECGAGIEHREVWVDQRMHECQLVLSGAARDYRSTVHFRAGSG